MNTRRLIRISLFTLLTIVGGFIRIPVGSICFTFQTFFVMLSGLFLGAKDGVISQIAYLLLGLIGLPVFIHGGGISYVFQPSFGYILGFVLGAFVCGLLAPTQNSRFSLYLACAISLIIIYLIGIGYQIIILSSVLMQSEMAIGISLILVVVMFVVDLAIFYPVCISYPKLKKLIKF